MMRVLGVQLRSGLVPNRRRWNLGSFPILSRREAIGKSGRSDGSGACKGWLNIRKWLVQHHQSTQNHLPLLKWFWSPVLVVSLQQTGAFPHGWMVAAWPESRPGQCYVLQELSSSSVQAVEQLIYFWLLAG